MTNENLENTVNTEAEDKNRGHSGDGFGCIFLAMLAMVPIIAGIVLIGRNNEVKSAERIAAQKYQAEIKRQETIQTLAKQYGIQMSPQEFREYVQSLGLTYDGRIEK